MFGNARIFIDLAKNDFTYHDDYESVMQFIKNNKKIPRLLEAIAASPKELANVERLRAAIAAGDLNRPVFSNSNCQLYVFYLFREKQIGLVDFLTLNMYLNVLCQHTDKQPIKETEKDLKILTEVTVVSVADQFDEMYDHLSAKFFMHKGAKTIEKETLRAELVKLNPLNQCVLRIKDYEHPSNARQPAKDELSRDYPFVFKSNGYIYVHLAGVCQAMLRMINPEMPVKMAPVFGNVGLSYLFKMHQKGFHPVALYSVFVASNVIHVHGGRMGLMETIMHDLMVHLIWGNLVQLQHYNFLFQCVLPAVEPLFNDLIGQIKKDYEDNTLQLSRPSNVLDLGFSHSVPYSDEAAHKVFINGMVSAVGFSFTRLTELYKTLLPRKKEIAEQFGIDIVQVFHDKHLLKAVAHGVFTVRDFIEETMPESPRVTV